MRKSGQGPSISYQLFNSGAELDPDWIQTQLDPRIRVQKSQDSPQKEKIKWKNL